MTSTVVGARSASNDAPLRCAVFLSGSGSGMEALVRMQQRLKLPHETTVVVSNKLGVEGLERAQRLGVPTLVVEQMDGDRRRTREEHEAEILRQLEPYDVEFIVLADTCVSSLLPFCCMDQPVVNIHPSLLPNFPGAHAHRDVLAANVGVSGCTVHLVDEGMDTGAILAQRPVPVLLTTMKQRQ